MGEPLAFGITAASRHDHARVGAAIERLGFAELWVNDNRRGDGLATLAEVAPGTTTLRFGVGVVALSDHSPAAIADRVRRASLPAGRVTLGVGSGASASLDLVRDGVEDLRRLVPEMPIAVAAVGPRMSRLAGAIADVVVANWALPERLTMVRAWVGEGAAGAARPAPRMAAYVRTAIGPGAEERLRAEMRRYAAVGRHYARAFAAQPDELVGVAVASADPSALASALEPYRAAVDTVVVRGLPAGDTVDAWLEIANATAARRDQM